MIKFRAEDKATGKPILGLGLSQGNWDRLLDGKPIIIKPCELGLPWDGEILIFGGETEQAMIHVLSRNGFIKDVPVHHFDESKEQKP